MSVLGLSSALTVCIALRFTMQMLRDIDFAAIALVLSAAYAGVALSSLSVYHSI